MFSLKLIPSVVLALVFFLRVIRASNPLPANNNGTEFNVLDFQAYILKPRNNHSVIQESQTKPTLPTSTIATVTDFKSYQPKLRLGLDFFADYFDNVLQRPRSPPSQKAKTTKRHQIPLNVQRPKNIRVSTGRNSAPPSQNVVHHQLLMNHVLYHTGSQPPNGTPKLLSQEQGTKSVNPSGILLYPSPSPRTIANKDSVLEQPPANSSKRTLTQNEQYFQDQFMSIDLPNLYEFGHIFEKLHSGWEERFERVNLKDQRYQGRGGDDGLSFYNNGYRLGNGQFLVESHEQNNGTQFLKKVKWGTSEGGFGEHLYDLNHHQKKSPSPA